MFELGNVVMTKMVEQVISREDIILALDRHSIGDWGLVEPEDAEANEEALINDDRILSIYESKDEVIFWIITEVDRSLTTVLLPEDY